MWIRSSLVGGASALALATGLWARAGPVPISPGDPSRIPLVEARCPAFSWGGVEGATRYELIVYRVGEVEEATEPVVRQDLLGSASSWTPSLDRCLERGAQYAWIIRAVVGEEVSYWSSPWLFGVATTQSLAPIEEEEHGAPGGPERDDQTGASDASAPDQPDRQEAGIARPASAASSAAPPVIHPIYTVEVEAAPSPGLGIAGFVSKNPSANYRMGIGGADYRGWNVRDQINSAVRLHITQGGSVGIGTEAPDSTLHVVGGSTVTALHVSGGATLLEQSYVESLSSQGIVSAETVEIRAGADLSESFRVAKVREADPLPGMVVSIDPSNPGALRVSNEAYDRLVTGVISGAGGVRTGMLMGQKDSIATGDAPVALAGRVYVRADAAGGAIQPGDLLTTSRTVGHAMKVRDLERARGAILGKAMTPLADGRGLVLVLLALQ
jgi:hypothetical protein